MESVATRPIFFTPSVTKLGFAIPAPTGPPLLMQLAGGAGR
jgi:hypothetical protein